VVDMEKKTKLTEDFIAGYMGDFRDKERAKPGEILDAVKNLQVIFESVLEKNSPKKNLRG
jgi:hypothetical protein